VAHRRCRNEICVPLSGGAGYPLEVISKPRLPDLKIGISHQIQRLFKGFERLQWLRCKLLANAQIAMLFGSACALLLNLI
jgi:hypothetical protein